MAKKINYDEYIGGKVDVYKSEKAIIRLYHPNLTPEERNRRMQATAEEFMRCYLDIVASGVDWEKFREPDKKKGDIPLFVVDI